MYDHDVAYTTYLPDEGFTPTTNPWPRSTGRSEVEDPFIDKPVEDGYLLGDGPYASGFRAESACESLEDVREVVVYTVVWREVSGRMQVLAGTRHEAGEGRLHGSMMLGWGGNVERQDCSLFAPPNSIIQRAVGREIEEELDVVLTERDGWYIPRHGLIYDPSDEVGRDHIAIVHSLQVEGAEVREKEKYGEGEWLDVVGGDAIELYSYKRFPLNEGWFENWSQLLTPHLFKIKAHRP